MEIWQKCVAFFSEYMNYNFNRVEYLLTNISSFVEFQRCWVLKSKIFGQESRLQDFFNLSMNDSWTRGTKIVLSKLIFYVKNQHNFFFSFECQFRRPLLKHIITYLYIFFQIAGLWVHQLQLRTLLRTDGWFL